MIIETIGIDADDTLWQNEQFFRFTEAQFAGLLADHADKDHLSEKLLAAERKNLALYGFGIKGFMLSMIETAITVTNGKVPGQVIEQILALGKDMLSHPIEPLPNVRETLEQLHPLYRLVMITKGDLFDQERKLAESGLGELFHGVEIVSNKDAATYQRIFSTYGSGPARAMMVGNSLKSDVLPALAAGAWGVFIPHPLTWALEHAETPQNHPRFRELGGFAELLQLLPDPKEMS